MMEFNISYPKMNEQWGKCEVKVPNDTVQEFLQHFQTLFSLELLQAQITEKEAFTFIKFESSKNKIRVLENIIQAVQQMTARLN